MTGRPPRVPTATYRLQLSRTFTFANAEALVPYLAKLGVSHLYTSPFLKARAGSPHGYDLTDFGALNPELGDEAALAALSAALARHGLGHILDFVPNHMGIGKADNAWWLDVLEWGQASPYAGYFDIDWTPAKPELRGRVLLPFLGDHYGEVLERGELAVAFDAAAGSFAVRYHEHLFPIRPAHYADILAPYLAQLRASGASEAVMLEELVARAQALRGRRLPVRRRQTLREQALGFKHDLAVLASDRPEVRAAIEAAVQAFNGTPGEARSFLALHRLLQKQAYRLAYWRVAADEINYRRFFDINELAGVKMERAALFEVAHELILRLLGAGVLHGLRIDHIDGLYDPAQYCQRLAAHAAEVQAAGGAGEGIYLVVEKILARHEALRRDWPIDGTTGYEMLNLVNGLFVEPEAESALDQAYRQFIGRPVDFDELLYACKRHVMRRMLASELQVLANALDRISESNWRTRDFTLPGLRAALEEVVACFPVYRTYVAEAGANAEDRRDIDWAVALARRHDDERESTIYDFIHAVLTTDLVRRRRSGYSRRAVIDFARKFQQFTGPVTAKAMEDTAFYRFHRLISLNEVGGDPRRFGTTLAAFHHVNQERAQIWPQAMIATTTHDTKRGEDARTRLDVLSELPAEWGKRARRWAALNRRAKVERGDRAAPVRNDEYFLYQTLVGAWPNELMDAGDLDRERLQRFRERIATWAIKAVREAKVHSSWAQPDQAYEEALTGFLQRILDPLRAAAFLADFLEFEARVAWFGMLGSLSQTLLKLTLPGVPDIYQGAELWDYSLVDPDNRWPVDFAHRRALLSALQRGSGAPEALLQAWTDGRIKLLLLSRLLALRRKRPTLLQNGSYLPLPVEGRQAEHLCAFARVFAGEALVVVAPRLFATLTGGTLAPPLGGIWGDTAVACPAEFLSASWIDVLTGESLQAHDSGSGGLLPAARLLARLPVAALITSEAAA